MQVQNVDVHEVQMLSALSQPVGQGVMQINNMQAQMPQLAKPKGHQQTVQPFW